MNEARPFAKSTDGSAGIEATMSRLKYQMNLAHLRIRGMPAMRYVVHLRALGLISAAALPSDHENRNTSGCFAKNGVFMERQREALVD